jgi:sugar phosphate isomerase/epimerase
MQPSLWTNMFHCVPKEQQVEELVAAGFEYAELACETVVDPETKQLSRPHAERLRKRCDALGLKTPQVHYPICTLNPEVKYPKFNPDMLTEFAHPSGARREFDLRCAEELLDLCPILGIEVMVVHPGGIVGWENEADLQRISRLNLDAFRRLACRAAQNGVIIALENMGKMGQRTSFGADFGQLISFVDQVASPNVAICLDTSHAHYMKVDIPAAIRQSAHRLVATHISDNLGSNDDHLFPYGGRINWPPVVAALRDVGYARLFNLETPGENRCPLDILRLKARYARNLLVMMLS